MGGDCNVAIKRGSSYKIWAVFFILYFCYILQFPSHNVALHSLWRHLQLVAITEYMGNGYFFPT